MVKSILPNGKCGDGEIMMNKKECKRKYPKWVLGLNRQTAVNIVKEETKKHKTKVEPGKYEEKNEWENGPKILKECSKRNGEKRNKY